MQWISKLSSCEMMREQGQRFVLNLRNYIENKNKGRSGDAWTPTLTMTQHIKEAKSLNFFKRVNYNKVLIRLLSEHQLTFEQVQDPTAIQRQGFLDEVGVLT